MNVDDILKQVTFYANILVNNKTAEAIVNVLSGPTQLELFRLSHVFKAVDTTVLRNAGFKDCDTYYSYHFEVTGKVMSNKDYDRLRSTCVNKCKSIFDLLAGK